MNGTQYIELLKYQESLKPKKKKLTSKQINGIVIIVISTLVLLICIGVLMELFFPYQPTQYGSTTILGFTINNLLLTFLLVCIGIGWATNGFGFIIVKG